MIGMKNGRRFLLVKDIQHKNLMKKPKKFSPRFITRKFYRGYCGCEREINRGQCFDWAYIAAHLYSDIELFQNDIHAWVRYKDKFYDAQAEDGVVAIDDLPLFEYPANMRFKTEFEEVDINDLKVFWSEKWDFTEKH